MRTDYTQAPSVKELELTLEREAKRQIPKEKLSEHFVDLTPFLELLRVLGYSTEDIRLDLPWQEVLVRGEQMVQQLVPLVLERASKLPQVVLDNAYGYLAEEDAPKETDLIFVFGAKTPARAEKAVELFKKGLAPKILFSGRGSSFEQAEESEAEKYQAIALAAGIPKEAIILEIKAITLPDNVKRSLNLLDRLGESYGQVILVNSPYSQRRGSGYFMKYSPVNTVVYRVNCQTREGLRANDWFTNETGIKYVLGEYGKIWISLATNTI